MDRQLAPLGDPAQSPGALFLLPIARGKGTALESRTRVRLEPPSPEAIRSGLSRAARARRAPNELREVSTRCGLGAAGAGERRGEARRALLQQRHVPLGAGQQVGELGQEVAVDLDVGARCARSSAAAASAR